MSRLSALCCVMFAFLAVTSAMYGSDSKVVKLTAANFRDKVINSNELWFVEFYAPWCGHCQRLTPEWEKLASALKGIINVGAVDMTTDQAAGEPYGIRGFPTLKFFGANKNSPADYQGQRTASDMLSYAFDQAKSAANARLSGKAGSSSGSSGNRANAGGQQQQGGCNAGGGQQQQQGGCNAGGGFDSQGGSGGSSNDKDVIVLTDSNFDDLVMKSEDLWIVEFYAPWCGHCKRLEPEWNQAATELKGEVKIAKVDATREHGLAGRFGVNSYPQIKLFPSGPKSEKNIEDYNGARDASSIVSWAQEKKAQFKPVMKVEQLVDQEIFEKYCVAIRGICFIAFLPHIYDSSAEERNNYISILQELSKSNRGGDVLPPLAAYDESGLVVSLGSFSKILAPGLRLGWAQSSKKTIEELSTVGVLRSGGGQNPVTASLVHTVLEQGLLLPHIDHLKNVFRGRKAAMCDALRQHCPDVVFTEPSGGYFVWLELPDGVHTERLLQESIAHHGVAFTPGTRCSLGSLYGDGDGGVHVTAAMTRCARLSFAFYDEDEIRMGIQRLQSAIAHLK